MPKLIVFSTIGVLSFSVTVVSAATLKSLPYQGPSQTSTQKSKSIPAKTTEPAETTPQKTTPETVPLQPLIKKEPTIPSTDQALQKLIPIPLTKLFCPAIPKTGIIFPKPVYDEVEGDCALLGRNEEIEAYLEELEQIAADCLFRREENWQKVLDARENLDNKIDQLSEPQPAEDTGRTFNTRIEPMCPHYTGDIEIPEPLELTPEEGMYYTSWLKRITENTRKYCQMIDELVRPISQGCDEINFYLTCEALTPERKEAYHRLLAGKMNAAEIGYEYTDFFYTNTLETFGWGNFREYYNEEAVDCPSRQPRSKIKSAAPRTIIEAGKSEFVGELIRNQEEIELSGLNNIVEELKISRGEIKADDAEIKVINKKILLTIGRSTVSVAPTEKGVLIQDGELAVTAAEVSIKNNALWVGESEVKLPVSEVAESLKVKPFAAELKEENSRAVYKLKVKEPRKLFGFIPIQITKTLTVDAELSRLVGERLPWYSFLTAR